jgi:hypothetical protein
VTGGHDGAAGLRGRLLGTWILRDWEAVGEDGSMVRPFGERPDGVLVYTSDGTMITTIGRRDRPAIGAGDPLHGPAEARLAAFGSFIAYTSAFEVHGSDVHHRVRMSLFPDWVGTVQVRHVLLADEDRTLVLSADPFSMQGRVSTHRLTWDRRSA